MNANQIKKEKRLLIPGPVPVDDEVLIAMGQPVVAHYGLEFTEFYNETVELLKRVFDTKAEVFVLVGSGTAAIDASIGSALSKNDKVLVGVNGYFGQKMLNIANTYGLVTVPVEKEWGFALTSKDFEKAFQKHSDAKAALVVHLETSTTIINPIRDIGLICHQHDAVCIVDAVSSLGGIPFHMDDWGVDFCATSTQKCLGAPPGLAPVAVSTRGWDLIEKNPDKGHGWYLNLNVWKQYANDWADWHPFPITMATNNVAALHSSLKSLLDEGLENRVDKYRFLAKRLRAGLREIGFAPYTADEDMAPTITAALSPDGIPTSQIVSYLANNHNIKIAGGLGELKDKIIRIGHMSPCVTTDDIDQLLFGLKAFLKHSKEENNEHHS